MLGVGKIQAAAETGQDHPQAEDIGQRVVMADLVLPRNVAGKVDGSDDDFGGSVSDRQIGYLGAPPSTSVVRWASAMMVTANGAVASMRRSAAALLRGSCLRASSNQIRTPSTCKASSPSSGATRPAACASRTSRTSGKKLPSASSVEKPPASSRVRRYS